MVADNAGLMFLKLLEHCGVREAVLAGFDGFRQAGAHYYRPEAALPVNAAEACEKQRRMEEQLAERYTVERLIPTHKDWNDDLTAEEPSFAQVMQ